MSISYFLSVHYIINAKNEADTDQRTLINSSLPVAIGFLKTGILFSLKMVHLYLNMVEMCL